jgi:hypothetical protein
LPDSTGAELLAHVPDIHRDARRGLLIRWGDRTTADWVVKASALGQIDAMVVEPWRDADEQFFYAVTDLLREWEQLHEPQFAAVRIVGDRWDAHSHGLQDALQRSGVPYRFYEGSDEGRAAPRSGGGRAADRRPVRQPGVDEANGRRGRRALGVNTLVGSRTSMSRSWDRGRRPPSPHGASEPAVVVLERGDRGQASSSSIPTTLAFPAA